MRRVNGIVLSAVACGVTPLTGTVTIATKNAYVYPLRRYTAEREPDCLSTKDGAKDSSGETSTTASSSKATASDATATAPEQGSAFATMDMHSKNFTPGKYKGAEEAAIRQEATRPLPAGVAAKHLCDDDDCMDCDQRRSHEQVHGNAHTAQESRARGGADPSTSQLSHLLGGEAAAVMALRSAEAAGEQAPPPRSPAASPTLEEERINAQLAALQARKSEDALMEMQLFLAQNTLRSMRQSVERESAVGDTSDRHRSRGGDERLPPGRRGVQALLDYNKRWAAEVTLFNPRYFKELAKEQKPEYLWIGCSDSRVPANEIVGLHPGDVFVHRNIGNILSLSDLNCLSALQFAIDALKVQHVIIAGHYKCGGVTAAMNGTPLGLTDHWIMQVTEIKNKFWDRISLEVPSADHLNVLCELNALQQLSHAASCRIVQRLWKRQNDNERYYRDRTTHVHVRPRYAGDHNIRLKAHSFTNRGINTTSGSEDEVECHGWVYSLDDGILRPLLSVNRLSDLKKEFEDATEAVFVRYASS